MKIFSLIITVVFLISPAILFAHGTGESFEATVDGYFIDVGYNTTEFVAGESVVFDFATTKDEEDVDYSDIWVRITTGNKTTLATGIHNAEFGGARMTYVFPEAGEYEMSVRFQNETDSVVETTFPFVVGAMGSHKGSNSLMSMLVGALVGAIAGTIASILFRSKSKA